MNEDRGVLTEISRRGFVTGVAAAGAALLINGAKGNFVDAAAISDIAGINEGATANAPAVRLNPPTKPVRNFNPWEPGETIAKVPNPYGFIALRMDDGPWPVTTRQLDDIFVAHDMRGKVSMAWILQNLEANSEVGQEIGQLYEVVSHSVTHRYGDAVNASEIEPANNGFQRILGKMPGVFAVPGLGQGPRITAEMTRLGMCATTTYDLSIGDTEAKVVSSDGLIARARAGIQSGSILIAHGDTSSHAQTRHALPYIIENARQDGFTWVTEWDLLHLRYNDDGTRKPEHPVLRIQNESLSSLDRTASMASYCCGHLGE